MNHKSSATTITIDSDISRLKNRVKPVPMLYTVGKAASKTQHCTDSVGPKGCTTNCTVAWMLSWD